MNKLQGITASPLAWPIDWPRTTYPNRSKYKSNHEGASAFVRARDGVLRNLKLMGVRRDSDAIISTNVPLRGDGLPYASFREPNDAGVAIYWVKSYSDQPMRVIASDRWKKVWENLHAVELALEALRQLERTGASQIVERAYQGFKALPPAATIKSWREVLEFTSGWAPGPEDLQNRYRRLAAVRHPDRGGSEAAMAELNLAYAQAKGELGYQ